MKPTRKQANMHVSGQIPRPALRCSRQSQEAKQQPRGSGTMDKRQRFELGDRIDYACRWAFPLGYGCILCALGALGWFMSGHPHS